MKQIALIDLDYFFAQCEQIRNPAIIDKPVVIVMPTVRGGGAIATCNYTARDLKIKSGMPLSLAKKLSSSDTVFIDANREYYKDLSKKVFEIVDFFCEKVEQVSIDEAYLDLTNPAGEEKAIEVCNKIKNKIKSDLNLTCSIGLSVNKLIAKMASDEKKPNGLTIIDNDKIESFLAKKKIEKLHGLGPKAAKLLNAKRINLISDLKKLTKEELTKMFGESKGEKYYNFSRGVDGREVNSNREKQQISRMMTLTKDTSSFDEIKNNVELLAMMVFKESKSMEKSFRTVSIIVITNKFETFTKSKTVVETIDGEKLKEISFELLKDFLNQNLQLIRRVGVRVSNFDSEYGAQKSLFDFR